MTDTLRPTSHGAGVAAWRRPAGLALAGAGAVAYTALVDPNRSGAFPFCPMKLLTGWDCPFCGSLRATHALAHGHIAAAVDHNVLFVSAVPFVLVAWATWLAAGSGWPVRRWRVPQRAWLALGAIAVVFMVVRNMPLPAVRWLDSR